MTCNAMGRPLRAVEARKEGAPRGLPLEALIQRVCRAVGVRPDVLKGGSRRPAVCRARQGIAYLWMEAWGGSGRQLASHLGVRPQSVYKEPQRGHKARPEWEQLIMRK